MKYPPPAPDHQANLHRQANEHPLVEDHVFRSMAEYILHLMHLKSYETAAEFCAGKDVLDWGCNIGYGMEVLARVSTSVAGLDLSQRAVEVARRRLGSTAATVQRYDGTRCGFGDQTFDVVTSFQVLEHVSDYDTYFGEILRVLRPSGMAIFATPNAALRLAPGMKPWNEFHIHEFAPSELREFLASWFQPVTIRGLFATDELYAKERNRLENAKRSALDAQRSLDVVRPLKAFVKQWFPFVVHVRDAIAVGKSAPRCPELLDEVELARFSLADLYYREEQLEDALDLMALCRRPS